MTQDTQSSDLTVTKTTEYQKPGAVVLHERENTRVMLQKLDKARETRFPDATPMVELWQECNKDFDTNDAILRNLKLVQFQIESMKEEYWSHKAKVEEELSKILEGGIDRFDDYKVAEEAAAKDDERAWKRLSGLMKLCVQLAKEFRACAMQRSVNVHVKQVDLLQQSFAAILLAHVHDPTILNAISDEMRIAYLALFPIDVKEGE